MDFYATKQTEALYNYLSINIYLFVSYKVSEILLRNPELVYTNYPWYGDTVVYNINISHSIYPGIIAPYGSNMVRGEQ